MCFFEQSILNCSKLIKTQCLICGKLSFGPTCQSCGSTLVFHGCILQIVKGDEVRYKRIGYGGTPRLLKVLIKEKGDVDEESCAN